MGNKRKSWILGTILVGLVVAAVTWTLALAPVRESTCKAKIDTESVEFENQKLETKVAGLRADYAKIEDLRAELADYARHIPATVDYESIVAEIDFAVKESEVSLISVDASEDITPVVPFTAIKVAAPKPVDPNAPEATDTEAAETQTVTPTETVSGAQPTQSGALSRVVEGFYQIPISVTVFGDYEEVQKFSARLQSGTERALMFYSVSLVAPDPSPESDTTPELEEGDVRYTLHGFAYALASDATLLAQEIERLAQPVTEMPTPGKENLFGPRREK